ncbi:MAG: transporter substrate-binding domain-containing protein [Syntrophorhabdaceae bacterium]|nr:transporter substrate-binding domain-containing protein [Syntrophorhabdaceae bacterium]
MTRSWLCIKTIIFLLLFQILFCIPYIQAKDVHEKKQLIVRADHNYPPYEFIDEKGEPQGFNIELIKAVAEIMGLDIKISLGPWNEVRTQLEKGEIDILAGMTYSVERDRVVDFSVPHSILSFDIFMRKDSSIGSIEDARDKEIIVQEGGIMHDYLKKQGITSKIITVTDAHDALLLLASGRHDCAILNKMQGHYFISRFKLTNIKAAGSDLMPREYCFAVTEGNSLLVSKLNTGLNILKTTNRYKEIYNKWLGIYEEKGISGLFRYLTIGFLIICILFALSIFWTWLLRKKVKEKTAELRKSEKKYRSIFENAIEGIFQTTPDGRVLDANPALARLFGFNSPQEFMDYYTNIGEQQYLKPEDREIYRGILEKYGTIKGFETQLVDRHGKTLWVTINAHEVTDEKGNVIYYEGTVEDITERKKREEQYRELQQQFIQSQKMEAIGRLAGGVAHDFNNILTVILGSCELALFDLKNPERIKHRIDDIKKAADRASSLTKQLLAYSRRQIMEMRVININELIINLEKMLKRLIGEDIELKIILKEDVGTIKADSAQIEQVIINLAVNARDAMPRGGKLTIETSRVYLDNEYAKKHQDVKPGPHIMLSISDTGVGISDKARQHLFEPFYTTKPKGEGTGLGLSTVYGIVKQSNGNIWVYSEINKGTTFKIYFPCVEAKIEDKKDVYKGREISHSSETILIIEDEESVRESAAEMLKMQGYNVLKAGSGEEAISICSKYRDTIHLILLDVVIPGIKGQELFDKIKEIHKEAVVLFMSGYTDNVIVHHGILKEGIEFIQKPFTLENISKKVREVLDRTGKTNLSK